MKKLFLFIAFMGLITASFAQSPKIYKEGLLTVNTPYITYAKEYNRFTYQFTQADSVFISVMEKLPQKHIINEIKILKIRLQQLQDLIINNLKQI